MQGMMKYKVLLLTFYVTRISKTCKNLPFKKEYFKAQAGPKYVVCGL